MFAVSPHSKRWRAAAVAISVSLLSPVALPPPAQAAEAELASWTALRPVVTASAGDPESPEGALVVGIVLGYRHLSPEDRERFTLLVGDHDATMNGDGGFAATVHGPFEAQVLFDGVEVANFADLWEPSEVETATSLSLSLHERPSWVLTHGPGDGWLEVRVPEPAHRVAARAGCFVAPFAEMDEGVVYIDPSDNLDGGFCLIDILGADDTSIGSLLVVSEAADFGPEPQLLFAGRGPACSAAVALAWSPHGEEELGLANAPGARVGSFVVAGTQLRQPIEGAFFGPAGETFFELPPGTCEHEDPRRTFAMTSHPTVLASGALLEYRPAAGHQELAAELHWSMGDAALELWMDDLSAGIQLGAVDLAPVDWAAWMGLATISDAATGARAHVAVDFEGATLPVLRADSVGMTWVSGPQGPSIGASSIAQVGDDLYIPNDAALDPLLAVLIEDSASHRDVAIGIVNEDGTAIVVKGSTAAGWTPSFTPAGTVGLGSNGGIVLIPASPQVAFETAVAAQGGTVAKTVSFPNGVMRECLVVPGLPVYFCYHPTNAGDPAKRPVFNGSSVTLSADGKGVYCPFERMGKASLGAQPRSHILCANGVFSNGTFTFDYATGVSGSYVLDPSSVALDHPRSDLSAPGMVLNLSASKLVAPSGGSFQPGTFTLQRTAAQWNGAVATADGCQRTTQPIPLAASNVVVRQDGGVVSQFAAGHQVPLSVSNAIDLGGVDSHGFTGYVPGFLAEPSLGPAEARNAAVETSNVHSNVVPPGHRVSYSEGTATRIYPGLSIAPSALSTASLRVTPHYPASSPTTPFPLDPGAPGVFINDGGVHGVVTKDDPSPVTASHCGTALDVRQFSQAIAADRAVENVSLADINLGGDLGMNIHVNALTLDGCAEPQLSVDAMEHHHLLSAYRTDFFLDHIDLTCTSSTTSDIALSGGLFVDPIGSPAPDRFGKAAKLPNKSVGDVVTTRVTIHSDPKGVVKKGVNILKQPVRATFERYYPYHVQSVVLGTSSEPMKVSGSVELPFFGRTPMAMAVDHSGVTQTTGDSSTWPAATFAVHPDDPSKRQVTTRLANSHAAMGSKSQLDVTRKWLGLPLDFKALGFEKGRFVSQKTATDTLKLGDFLEAKRAVSLDAKSVKLDLGAKAQAGLPTTTEGWIHEAGSIYAGVCQIDPTIAICEPLKVLRDALGSSGPLKFLGDAIKTSTALDKAVNAMRHAGLKELESTIGAQLSVLVHDGLEPMRTSLAPLSALHSAVQGTSVTDVFDDVRRACDTAPTSATTAQLVNHLQHTLNAAETALQQAPSMQNACGNFTNFGLKMDEIVKTVADLGTALPKAMKTFDDAVTKITPVLSALQTLASKCKRDAGFGSIVPLMADHAGKLIFEVLARIDKARWTPYVEGNQCVIEALANPALCDGVSQTTYTTCVTDITGGKADSSASCAKVSKCVANLKKHLAADDWNTLGLSCNPPKGKTQPALSGDALVKAVKARASATKSWDGTIAFIGNHASTALAILQTAKNVFVQVAFAMGKLATPIHKSLTEIRKSMKTACEHTMAPFAKTGGIASALQHDLTRIKSAPMCTSVRQMTYRDRRRVAALVHTLADAGDLSLFTKVEKAIGTQVMNGALGALKQGKLWQTVDKLMEQVVVNVTKGLGKLPNRILGAIMQGLDSSTNPKATATGRKHFLALDVDGKGEFSRSKVSPTDVRLDSLAMEAGLDFKSPKTSSTDPKKKAAKESDAAWSARVKAVVQRLNKTENVGCSTGQQSEFLDLSISTNLPITFGKKTMNGTLSIGTLLQEAGNMVVPNGIKGGFSLDGDIEMGTVVVKKPGFALSIGDKETYLAAASGLAVNTNPTPKTGSKGGSVFDLEGAIFVGKACSLKPISRLDKKMGAALSNCPGRWGAYIRGEGKFPIVDKGCLFNVKAAAGVNLGVFEGSKAGNRFFNAGLNARISAQAGCVVSAAGEIELKGGYDGSWKLGGELWAAGGVGACEPETWTDLSTAMKDDWCLTCGVGGALCLEEGKDVQAAYAIGCEDPTLSTTPPCTTPLEAICPVGK